MSLAQLARIRARTVELAAEEMSLAQLRKARAMTQTALARKLGKTQALVSRIESAGDLYISTMRKQIEALGGGLDIRTIFPDMAPVSITGVKELAQPLPLDASATNTKKLKTAKLSVKRPKVRPAAGRSPARSKQPLRVATKLSRGSVAAPAELRKLSPYSRYSRYVEYGRARPNIFLSHAAACRGGRSAPAFDTKWSPQFGHKVAPRKRPILADTHSVREWPFWAKSSRPPSSAEWANIRQKTVVRIVIAFAPPS